jgi:hypothetical protein
MHPLIPYLRRDGHLPLPRPMLRRIEAALNEVESLKAEIADQRAQLDRIATDRTATKGRKESAA